MADDIFKVIFQMEAQGQGVFDEINKVKGKYVEVNDELQKQAIKLQTLLANEQALLKGRAAANSPSAVAKYNAELDKVNTNIALTTETVKKLTTEQERLGKTTDTLGKTIQETFKTTQVNALNNQIKVLTKDFGISGTETAKFGVKGEAAFEKFKEGTKEVKSGLKEIDPQSKKTGEDIEKHIGEKGKEAAQSLIAQFRALKRELATTTDPTKFAELSVEAGKLQNKILDASAAAQAFATDSKFTTVGTLLKGIGSKLFELDFKGAADKASLLSKAASAITFKESLIGIKDLSKTLLTVGKALLTNPIFLIGAAVVLIIKNFAELKNSGGAIGTVFKAIGDSIDFVIELFFALTDAIGLTTHAMDNFNKKTLEGTKAILDQQNKNADRLIEIAKAAGKETDKLETTKLNNIIKNGQLQLKVYQRMRKDRAQLSKDELKDENEVAQMILDAQTKRSVIGLERSRKFAALAKKAFEDIEKSIDDLRKKLAEAEKKDTEFNIKFRLPKDSIEQIQALADVQRQGIEEQFQEQLKGLEKQKSEAQKHGVFSVSLQKKINEAILNARKLRTQNLKNIEQEELLSGLNAIKAKGDAEIQLRKETDEKLLDKFIADANLSEVQIAETKLAIQKKFFEDSIKLAEADIAARKTKNLDTTDQEKALAKLKLENIVTVSQAERDIANKKFAEEDKEITNAEAHSKVLLQLHNKRNSTLLFDELKFEQARLQLLKNSGKEFTDEYQKQQDKVNQLNKEAKKERLLEDVGYYEQLTTAAFNATNTLLTTKIQEIDKLTGLQQKRVDEAKALAEKGNAELLEEEQKRLTDLNKEKEKFVRQQQALAVVELISNSAIAVSKAAAQGGVAAGITIAATLIALVAGLAQARSIASQAAFYEGGYTGDGNPRDVSNALGERPYTYHKGEFVIDHKKTAKFKPILEQIHSGNVDLLDWQAKVNAFNRGYSDFNMQRAINGPTPQVINNIEIGQLKEQMGELINAVKAQGFGFNIDENGFSGFVTKVTERKNFIRNTLAK